MKLTADSCICGKVPFQNRQPTESEFNKTILLTTDIRYIDCPKHGLLTEIGAVFLEYNEATYDKFMKSKEDNVTE